jgi:flavin reductase
MRTLASAVNVVRVRDGHKSDGLTATAVCSLSAEPPHRPVCVGAAANAHDSLRRIGAFCLNVLARDQKDIARRFANMAGAGRDERIDLGRRIPLVTGA